MRLRDILDFITGKRRDSIVRHQWLKCELYALVKSQKSGSVVNYFWQNDKGEKVSSDFGSQAMAEVHFGNFMIEIAID